MRRLSVFTALAGYGGLLVVLRPRAADGAFWSYWQADPQRALVAVAGLVGWCLAAWLFAASVLAVAGRAPSAAGRIAGRLGALITPRAARHLLEVALGLALAVGPAGAALAGPSAEAPVPAPIVAAADPTFPSLDRPLPSPALSPAPAEQASPSATPRAAPQVTVTPAAAAPVVTPVEPGDTLWGLAAAALPAGASPAAITAQWQQWYAGNRATIGADPNLLLPGELLSLPRVAS